MDCRLASEEAALGRVASRIAAVLKGKHKHPTPHNDNGDFVIVVNAESAKLTGRKNEQKVYYHHTGYFGGIKSITTEKLREKDATQMIEKAVRECLKTSLGRRYSASKVYNGAEHPHSAQHYGIGPGETPGKRPMAEQRLRNRTT